MLTVSVFGVVFGIVAAVLGFLLVAGVCAAILALLQLVLPKTDSGAEALDRHDGNEPPGRPQVG